jgi:hypothetical protein
MVYGPFRLKGEFTTPSNLAFHRSLAARCAWWPWHGAWVLARARPCVQPLRPVCRFSATSTPIQTIPHPALAPRPRRSNPEWGYRDTDDVEALARRHGLALEAIEPMPANNFFLAFRAGGQGGA